MALQEEDTDYNVLRYYGIEGGGDINYIKYNMENIAILSRVWP